MKRILMILLPIIFWLLSTPTVAMQQIFYVLRDNNITDYAKQENLLTTLAQHQPAINLIIAQAFHIDGKGTVWGSINQKVLKFAHDHNIPMMALVNNQELSQDVAHAFLQDKAAQTKAIESIVSLCQQYHLYGIQIDFEDVAVSDKQAFTEFYTNLATALHQQQFAISIAILPRLSNTPSDDFSQAVYDYAAGAYDYQALGKASDFVSLMAYNQHTVATTPGPVAGIPWVKQLIQYALKYIPATKISLGVPGYATYWYTSTDNGQVKVSGQQISFAQAMDMLKMANADTTWDAKQKVPYAMFTFNHQNAYVFIEDAQSLKYKLELIKQYHLRGFSMWQIQAMDPMVWQVLANTKPNSQ